MSGKSTQLGKSGPGRKSNTERSEIVKELEKAINDALENASDMTRANAYKESVGTFVGKIEKKTYVLSQYQRDDSNWSDERKFGYVKALLRGTADIQFIFHEVPTTMERRVTRSQNRKDSERCYDAWDGGHRSHTLYSFLHKNEPILYSTSKIPFFFKEPNLEQNPEFFRTANMNMSQTTNTEYTWRTGVAYEPKDSCYVVLNEEDREILLEQRYVHCIAYSGVSVDEMSTFVVDRHLGQKPEPGEIINMMRANKTPALDVLDSILVSAGWINKYFAQKGIGTKLLAYLLFIVQSDAREGSTTWYQRRIYGFFHPVGDFDSIKANKLKSTFEALNAMVPNTTILKTMRSKEKVYYATVMMGLVLAMYWTDCRSDLTIQLFDRYVKRPRGKQMPTIIKVANDMVASESLTATNEVPDATMETGEEANEDDEEADDEDYNSEMGGEVDLSPEPANKRPRRTVTN